MRKITQSFNVYKFKEATKELKEKILQNFDTDGSLYSSHMEERINTLKKAAELLNADLDYSLSCVPDRGEFLSMKPKEDELDFQALYNATKGQNCELTGVCYDTDLTHTFNENNLNVETLNDALSKYISDIHKEYEGMFEEETFNEMCEANNYEFTDDGNIFS